MSGLGDASFLALRNYSETNKNTASINKMNDMLSPMMATMENNTRAITKMSVAPASSRDPSGGLIKYFENEKTGNEEFTVKDVYYREENNCL